MLGLEVQQLNGYFVYDLGRANQIATLDHLGLFDASPGDPATLPALPTRDGTASDEEKAGDHG